MTFGKALFRGCDRSRQRSEIVVESYVATRFLEFWSMFVQSWSSALMKPYTGVSHSQTILSGEGALSHGVLVQFYYRFSM